MKRDELIQEFIERTIEATKELFVSMEGKYFAPMVHVLSHTEGDAPVCQTVQIPMDFLRSGATKDLLADIVIPGIIRKFSDVVAVAFVSDSWLTTMKQEQYDQVPKESRGDIDRLTVATKTEKQSCLMFNFSTYSKSILIYQLYDTVGGRVMFTKRIDDMKMDKHRSRFANLLKPDPQNN